jgi:NADH-quinone oxidoreductase subunit C
MSLDDFIADLKHRLPDLEAVRPRIYAANGCHLEIRAGRGDVAAVAGAAQRAGFFLEALTAIDFTDGPQVIYLFNACDAPARVQVRVPLEAGESLATISGVYDAALWYEREVFDLFGIRFDDHPDLRRLLLPEDADFHPLRKDFGKVHAFKSAKEIYAEPTA